jgi:hypothetical protein
MVILCPVFAFGARRVLNLRAYGNRDKRRAQRGEHE